MLNLMGNETAYAAALACEALSEGHAKYMREVNETGKNTKYIGAEILTRRERGIFDALTHLGDGWHTRQDVARAYGRNTTTTSDGLRSLEEKRLITRHLWRIKTPSSSYSQPKFRVVT